VSRTHLEHRRLAEQHWPNLSQLLGAYFGQDVFHEFDTLPSARRAAVAGYDLDGRKQVVREWVGWNRQVGAGASIRAALDAYGVELDFDSEAEARNVMNDLYDALVVDIRKHDDGWRP